MNSDSSKLKEVALVFFKLGCFAFGGPAAHIAMMESEIIEKRKWMTHERFLDLVGATNLIPGPNSTEMTMHCGHERAGKLGLLVAGACFIFPATIITGILAWLYVTYGQLPNVEPFVFGIKPAVLAIIAGAIFKLGKKALKNVELVIIGTIVVIACLFGTSEIYALLCAGIIGAIYFQLKNKTSQKNVNSVAPLLLSLVTTKSTTGSVFWSFLKVGSILYGSGYVLFAYLDAELVANGWLTRQELLDAIAAGQFTPGPVLSTATFIGFQLSGLTGAIAATAGIFLPSFVFVALLYPLINILRNSSFLSGFLNCVNVAAVGVMVAVLLEMGKDVLINWQSAVIALLSFIVTFGVKKVNAMWTIIGGSILGYALSFVAL